MAACAWGADWHSALSRFGERRRNRRDDRYRISSKESMVPGAGIEPARLSAGDFESPASTNFTTRAERSEALNYGTVWAMNYQTIEDAIGKTPLVALQRIYAAENAARGNVILGKLE